jgi:hypothetical protein
VSENPRQQGALEKQSLFDSRCPRSSYSARRMPDGTKQNDIARIPANSSKCSRISPDAETNAAVFIPTGR